MFLPGKKSITILQVYVHEKSEEIFAQTGKKAIGDKSLCLIDAFPQKLV